MASYSIGGSPTINEVKTVLGETTTSLRKLVASFKINKWSLWKPIQSNKITIDIDEINAQKAGLELKEITYNGKTFTGDVAASGNFDMSIPLVVNEAYYKQPSLSPWEARLGDFRWYSHDTPPTDSDYKEYYPCIKAEYNLNVGANQETSGSSTLNRIQYENSNIYDWYPSSGTFMTACSQGLVSCFAFRYSTDTGANIGNPSELIIPLSMFNPVTGNNRLRIGLLFKIGNRWRLCVSAKTLKQNAGRTGGDVIPTLGTNTLLAKTLKELGGTVTVIPCLAENATVDFSSVIPGSNGTQFMSEVRNWSRLYSMPSGQGEFELTSLKQSDPVPDTSTIYGKITMYKAGGDSVIFSSTYTFKTFKDAHTGIVTSGWCLFLADNLVIQDDNYGNKYRIMFIAFVTKADDWNSSKKLILTTAPTSAQNITLTGTLEYNYISSVSSTGAATLTKKTYSGGSYNSTTLGNTPNYGLFVYKQINTSDRIYGSIIDNAKGISIEGNNLKYT